jgi:DNA-binding NtrC family response regulator
LSSGGIDLDKEIESFEKRWLQEALQQSKQVKDEAARLLGVDRNTKTLGLIPCLTRRVEGRTWRI